MPQLEYAGGIRFYFCWYYSVPGATRSLNNAFPELLHVGPSGVYMYYAYYLVSMNNAFPLLTRIDGFFRIEYCFYFTVVQGSAQVTIANSFTSLSTVASYMYVECTRARARVCLCMSVRTER